MKAIITPSPLCGEVNIPSSKSASHRAIISAALANGTSRITGVTMSDDIKATIGAMKALGAVIENDGDDYVVTGITEPPKSAEIDCGESGSTLRFLVPVAAALGVKATFIGRGRLIERPLSAITDLLGFHGVSCQYTSNVNLPLVIDGKMPAGVYEIGGNISSQYISGLLFALAYIGKRSEIKLTSELESAGYVEMTISSLKAFGAEIEKTENGYDIFPAKLNAKDTAVEGDWSQAAFFLAAAALGGDIKINGLDKNSVQGDKACLDIFRNIGANINWEGETLHAKSGELNPVSIDASQIPDIIPPIAVVLGQCKGQSMITNAYRLRIKESDRLSAIARGLVVNGVSVIETRDSLCIDGGTLSGGVIDGFNDHRIVMAFSIGAAFAGKQSTVTDAEAINKSYPKFFEDYKAIGGAADVI